MSPIRVAIFEDSRPFRESLEFILLSQPDMLLCGSFPNADRLLSRIAEAQPDVVLMDIHMPGLTGIEAVAKIKENYPAVQVCMQTVFEEDDKVYAALCAGASGYILKSSPAERVLGAVREVAEGGAFFTPSIAKKVLAGFNDAGAKPETILLSDRERDVLRYLVEGMSYKMIAAACGIAYDTAHTHVRNIYKKMHVSSKGEAVSKALRQRLV
jgi:DNA-binding NarL/FixJ family response regulator